MLGPLSTVVGGDVLFRWQAVGRFALKLKQGAEAQVLAEPGAGIVITTDDGATVLMSGAVNRHELAAGADGLTWTFSGEEDTHLLDILAWPVPGAALTAQSVEAWTMTGPAETVMKTVVQLNAARLGIPLSVTIPASPLGLTVTARARMTGLLELLPKLSEAGGGLGWRVVRPITGVPVFEVWEPMDRSTQVLFSADTGSLQGFEYTRVAPTVTRVVVGGAGEGVARTFQSTVDTAAEAEWGFVHEDFRDQRQTDDTSEMGSEAELTLAENGDLTRLALTVADLPDQTYGVHYQVGDLVPVQVTPGNIIVDRVLEVRVSLSPGDFGIRPIVGKAEDRPSTAKLRHLGAALRNLERSY